MTVYKQELYAMLTPEINLGISMEQVLVIIMHPTSQREHW